MSRVGKAPVAIPKGADVQVSDDAITVKGPLGTLTQQRHKLVGVKVEDNQVLFTTLGEANMQIELLCFIEDIELQARVSSDLLFDIFKGLQGIGLCVPGGPPVVASPVLDQYLPRTGSALQ